ncbi:serine hydrolase domain-containing protein [Echinicola shivajiensis]|uniref:serine hydrolase domain-containing protein n=1 Tax=Echinicola shivajiensis TaxID=1035916 RepID=UPI001BFC9F42|nr:serine hydrolase domain-containing protein [Echinicola shivajiensis]
MVRKILLFLLMVLIFAGVAVLYFYIQNKDHHRYLNSLSKPEQIDEGINYILNRYNVKGASIAVIDNYELKWAKGFGITDAEEPRAVTAETLFDVASISKPLTAFTALKILDKKNISIDTPANKVLRSWKIPDNQFTDSAQVSIRQLLSHRGGINLHGYMGYTKEDTLPTLIEELNGIPPSKSEKIKVIQVPGKSFIYSGGGYYIIQQLLEDISQVPFDQLVKNIVFSPLEMCNSTFQQDSLESYYPSIASAHYKGKLIKIKRMRFGAGAAGGLKSTAEDLGKFILEIMLSLKSSSNKILNQDKTKQLLFPESPNYGLGFMLNEDFFGHGGANVGFISTIIAHKEKGYGIVLLTNSSRDDNLLWLVSDKSRKEIIDLVARVYQWETLPYF